MWAAEAGREHVVDFLLSISANINSQSDVSQFVC
jgi:ankyrin repeat protein